MTLNRMNPDTSTVLPLQPNINPHSNLILLCPLGLLNLQCSLNHNKWDFYLAHYQDREFVSSILNIFKVWRFYRPLRPSKSQFCRNLQSAMDFPHENF